MYNFWYEGKVEFGKIANSRQAGEEYKLKTNPDLGCPDT